MPRTAAPGDRDLPLDVLAAEDRDAAVRWLWCLGMEPEELDAVPPLRALVDMLAVIAIADTLMPPMTREQAWCAAARQLEVRNPLRTWFRWQRRALEQAE
jgi:hypothetical protein